MGKDSIVISREKKAAITSEDLKRGWIDELTEIPLIDYRDGYKRKKGIAPAKKLLIKWK